MEASSQELWLSLSSKLEKNGTPNRFPKVLPAKIIEQQHLQSIDLKTLLASFCISGATEKFDNTVEKMYDDGMHIADLLFKLRIVERSIHPGSDANSSQKSFFCQQRA